jgi:ABC-type antimicrobial peptide transport system permease subunit
MSKPPIGVEPSLTKRACYFVLGALLGATLGYGFISAGPGPTPSVFEPHAALWVFGGAVICGLLAAYSPDKFLDGSRRFHRRDDDTTK